MFEIFIAANIFNISTVINITIKNFFRCAFIPVDWTVEYSAEGYESYNEFSGNDFIPSDAEDLVLEIWVIWTILHCHYSQVHADPEW